MQCGLWSIVCHRLYGSTETLDWDWTGSDVKNTDWVVFYMGWWPKGCGLCRFFHCVHHVLVGYRSPFCLESTWLLSVFWGHQGYWRPMRSALSAGARAFSNGATAGTGSCEVAGWATRKLGVPDQTNIGHWVPKLCKCTRSHMELGGVWSHPVSG